MKNNENKNKNNKIFELILSDFSDLAKTVDSVQRESALPSQIYELITTGISTSLKDIILGRAGIYTILSEGIIKKVSLYPPIAEADRNPKYHIFLCDSLKNELSASRREFKIARRKDNKFHLKIIGKYKKIIYEERKLSLCMFCLNRLNSLTNTEQVINAEDFLLSDFLNNDNYFGISSVFNFNYDMIPGIYDKLWQNMAKFIKIRNDYICARCFLDLKDKFLQKYLHVHYASYQVLGKKIDTIEPLCIYCHAKEDGHSGFEKIPVYKEFEKILKSRGILPV